MFKIGQKVVCLVGNGKYCDAFTREGEFDGPKKGDILEVSEVESDSWIGFLNHNELYHSKYFAPINTSTADIAQQIFSQHPELQEIKIPEMV